MYISLHCFISSFFQEAGNNRLKKSYLAKFCNIIFLFLLKVGSIGPVDQQINLVSPYPDITDEGDVTTTRSSGKHL